MINTFFAVGAWIALFIGFRKQPPSDRATALSTAKAAGLATLVTVVIVAVSYAKFQR